MLSVDYRQIQQRLQKLEGENRQVPEFIHSNHDQFTDLLDVDYFFVLLGNRKSIRFA